MYLRVNRPFYSKLLTYTCRSMYLSVLWVYAHACILALPHTSTPIEVDRKEAIGFVCRQFTLHVVNLGLVTIYYGWMYSRIVSTVHLPHVVCLVPVSGSKWSHYLIPPPQLTLLLWPVFLTNSSLCPSLLFLCLSHLHVPMVLYQFLLAFNEHVSAAVWWVCVTCTVLITT